MSSEDYETIEGSWLKAKYVISTKVCVAYIGSDTYEMSDMPKDVWDEWKNASSVGSHFNKHIRGNYNHSMFS